MPITNIPYEILSTILEEAAELNEREGATFTFGISQPPRPGGKPPVERYIRGHIPPDKLRWSTSASIRRVCSAWHEWALEYSLKQIYVRHWRGSEKWLNLPRSREQYAAYELNVPKSSFAYKDPFLYLRNTADTLSKCPLAASKVRRLWFDGLHTAETDVYMSTILRSCPNLKYVSLPWAILRRLSAAGWTQLLSGGSDQPLYSLELRAVDLSAAQKKDEQNFVDLRPLQSVDFSTLRRLKFVGDTSSMPVTDDDLKAIARTVTNLEEFHITCLSTITINGVMAIVKSAQRTLRVLEHSPRSDDGFWHPHPGTSADSDHICTVLSHCPKLVDLSISIPSVCAELFSNPNVRWKGDCQVRALHLCDDKQASRRVSSDEKLGALLNQARALTHARASTTFPEELFIELFFADFIFEPHLRVVHGVFEFAEMASNGAWPASKKESRKGPYGSTGLYGKDEEASVFEMVDEADFLSGAGLGWVRVGG